MTNIERNVLGSRYIDFRANPDNDQSTDGMWCGQRGYTPADLAAWKSSDSNWAQRVLDLRRKNYADQMRDVDAALLKKAKGGDTKAAELLYRRFENWTPKIAEDSLKRNPTNKTLAELISEGS